MSWGLGLGPGLGQGRLEMGQGAEKEGGSEVERKAEKVGRKKRLGAKLPPIMTLYFSNGTW